MPPPTVSGRKISLRDGADGARERAPAFERRRDVEDDDLVDAFDVVAAGQLRGIAGVPQLLELNAFDDLPVAHVHAGDDPFGQHVRQHSRKLRRICRPASPDFSG